MVTQPEGFSFSCLFVESPHGFIRVSINFYRSVVDFREGLDFQVISPDGVEFFALDVGVEIFCATNDEVLEELLFLFNVLYTLNTNQSMFILVSVCQEGYASKQTVPVLSDLHYF